MTTISNNRRRKRISPGSVLFSVFFILLLAAALFWRDQAASLLWRGLAPVFSIRDQGASAAGGFLGVFGSNAALASENARLRAALASSSIAVANRNILIAENTDLRARLGRTSSSTSVIAGVLLAPPAVPYDTLMIDAGKDSGVKEGDLVSAEGSIFIGKIAQAYDTTSRVVLFSAPGQTYQAQLRGTIPISIAGQGAGSFSGELPVGIDAKVGDPVLLPGISPEYVAVVSAVVHHEGESFQTLYLSLPANALSLHFVHVHTNPR